MFFILVLQVEIYPGGLDLRISLFCDFKITAASLSLRRILVFWRKMAGKQLHEMTTDELNLELERVGFPGLWTRVEAVIRLTIFLVRNSENPMTFQFRPGTVDVPVEVDDYEEHGPKDIVEDILFPGQPEIAADVPEVAMSFAIDAIDKFIPGSHDVYAPIEVMEDKIVSSDGTKDSDVEDILVPVDAVEDVLVPIDAVENMLDLGVKDMIVIVSIKAYEKMLVPGDTMEEMFDPCQVLEPVEGPEILSNEADNMTVTDDLDAEVLREALGEFFFLLQSSDDSRLSWAEETRREEQCDSCNSKFLRKYTWPPDLQWF